MSVVQGSHETTVVVKVTPASIGIEQLEARHILSDIPVVAACSEISQQLVEVVFHDVDIGYGITKTKISAPK